VRVEEKIKTGWVTKAVRESLYIKKYSGRAYIKLVGPRTLTQ
jgi:hypothetical protein